MPGAGPQAKESATVSSPVPMSPTRKRALDHYLTLRRFVCRITFFKFSLFFLSFLISILLNCFSLIPINFLNLFSWFILFSVICSSGWIPDGQGRWVKDENVEFDSDEEEPPDLSLDWYPLFPLSSQINFSRLQESNFLQVYFLAPFQDFTGGFFFFF